MENEIDKPRLALAPNGNFLMTIPHRLYAGLDHHIEIPSDANGLRLIKRILAARNSGKSKLGQDGNPTQSVVEAWLKNKAEVDAITKKEEDAKLDAEALSMFS